MVRPCSFRHRRRSRPQAAFGALAERGGPAWLRWAIWTLGVLGSSKMQPFFRMARKKQDRVPRDVSDTRFVIPDLEEIAGTLSEEPAS